MLDCDCGCDCEAVAVVALAATAPVCTIVDDGVSYLLKGAGSKMREEDLQHRCLSSRSVTMEERANGQPGNCSTGPAAGDPSRSRR